MHKLTHVESQRVIGVLDETLERLGLISKIPEGLDLEVQEKLEENRCLDAKVLLETQYQLEEAIANTHAVSKETVQKKILLNTRGLCRVLRDDPVSLEILQSCAANGEDLDKLFTLNDTITELKAIASKSLTTTLEDEGSAQKLLGDISTRQKEAEEDKETLETELSLARREKNREIGDLEAILSKLRENLEEIKTGSSNESRKLQDQTTEKMKIETEKHNKETEALLSRIRQLKEEIQKAAEESDNNEIQLRKKKNKAENEAQSWINRYDTDMKEKYSEYQQLKSQHDKEIKELQELTEYFEKVDDELDRIEEEETKWQEFVDERFEKERIYDDGAAAVQKLYRGRVARVEVAALKKKSKKGGKKKK